MENDNISVILKDIRDHLRRIEGNSTPCKNCGSQPADHRVKRNLIIDMVVASDVSPGCIMLCERCFEDLQQKATKICRKIKDNDYYLESY